jgi:dienelactone hydrolase
MERLAFSTLRAGTWHVILFLSAILLAPACDDGNDVTAPVPTIPTVAGTVMSSATGDPVAGAEVSIGAATATTGPDGRFELIDLTAGPATLRCIATGFEDFEADITVPTGRITRDVELSRIELFELGDFTLYVPATVSTTRGILLALGGPDTRGFASGTPFGAPVPEVEASLQALGQEFRTIAASHGLAVLGTSLAAMTNGPDSDQLLLDAVQEAAAMSGRPELASAPLLMYGMSGGGPQASGFTARNPERVAGLFLKVPVGVASLTSGEVLGVPTYVVQAEMDAFVDNAALASAFEANRATGALWALALEPGVPHHSLTPSHRELTTNWMSTILELRLGAASSPLRAIVESSGWLGDPATGEVTPWAAFAGDPASASWFPTRETAERWKTFVGQP